MTPTRLLSESLQRLPEPLRKALYSILGLIGAALAVCAGFGIEELGPVTLTQALEVYVFLSAATGGVAFANVGDKSTEPAALSDFDEDVDLSSFEPVGHVDDVFGPVPA
ncbi:MAG: hypothetical protein ACRDOM_10445 [Nocardioides sp.]